MRAGKLGTRTGIIDDNPTVTLKGELAQQMDDDESEGEDMKMEPFQYKGFTYYLTDVGGDEFDENWVISEEQGEDEECDPHEFMQLGTWTGDIKNPTVKMHD
jgi:hypothetical protein